MRNLLLGSLFPNPVTGTEATLIASHVLKSGGYVYNVYILCLFIEGDFVPFGKYVLFVPATLSKSKVYMRFHDAPWRKHSQQATF